MKILVLGMILAVAGAAQTKLDLGQINGTAPIPSLFVLTPDGYVAVNILPYLVLDMSTKPYTLKAAALDTGADQIVSGQVPMFRDNTGMVAPSPLRFDTKGNPSINGVPWLPQQVRSLRARLTLADGKWTGTTGGKCDFADVFRNGQLLEPQVDYTISQDGASLQVTVVFPVTTNAVAANIVTVICR